MRQYLGPEKQDRIVHMLTAEGMPVRRIVAALGCNVSNVRATVSSLAAQGRIFTARACTSEAKLHEVWAFPTAADRDRFAEERRLASALHVIEYRKAQAEKRKKARHAEGRSRSAMAIAAEAREAQKAVARAQAAAMRLAEAEQRKERARLDREAKEAAKQREKAEAKKTQQLLKVETKAAGALVFKKGTDVATPKKPAWADIPVNNPNGIEPTRYESNFRDRFAPAVVPSVVNSRECRSWAEAVAA